MFKYIKTITFFFILANQSYAVDSYGTIDQNFKDELSKVSYGVSVKVNKFDDTNKKYKMSDKNKCTGKLNGKYVNYNDLRNNILNSVDNKNRKTKLKKYLESYNGTQEIRPTRKNQKITARFTLKSFGSDLGYVNPINSYLKEIATEIDITPKDLLKNHDKIVPPSKIKSFYLKAKHVLQEVIADRIPSKIKRIESSIARSEVCIANYKYTYMESFKRKREICERKLYDSKNRKIKAQIQLERIKKLVHYKKQYLKSFATRKHLFDIDVSNIFYIKMLRNGLPFKEPVIVDVGFSVNNKNCKFIKYEDPNYARVDYLYKSQIPVTLAYEDTELISKQLDQQVKNAYFCGCEKVKGREVTLSPTQISLSSQVDDNLVPRDISTYHDGDYRPTSIFDGNRAGTIKEKKVMSIGREVRFNTIISH